MLLFYLYVELRDYCILTVDCFKIDSRFPDMPSPISDVIDITENRGESVTYDQTGRYSSNDLNVLGSNLDRRTGF